jgi:DNA polymerase/3'-5' exonuclease PolX
MTLDHAKHIAEGIVAKMAPYVERVKICGSIRRQRPEPSDIDIVVIPKRDQVKDMFGQVIGYEPVPEFCQLVNSWQKVKGEPTGKYTQRMVNGVKVELSITVPEAFGNITLIRTGNADFSHMIMKRVLKLGFEQRGGHLYDGDRMIPLYEEEEYFKILNLPFIEPKDRDMDAFKRK